MPAICSIFSTDIIQKLKQRPKSFIHTNVTLEGTYSNLTRSNISPMKKGIPLTKLFSNALELGSFLTVRGPVPHPYKIIIKLKFSYILIFMLLNTCSSLGTEDSKFDVYLTVHRADYSLQPGHLSSLPAPNFQPTATQEPDRPCGNQHYSRELLLMGITVPETC